MCIKCSVIPSKSLVYVRYMGVITYGQRIAHLNQLSQDPMYQAPMKKLVDLRKCRQYKLSAREEECFASRKADMDDRFSGERCAVCAPRDLEYGMSRMHELLTSESSIETMVFRNIEKATAWLRLKPEDIDLISCFQTG
jgi:hypothetical protein